MPSAAEAQGGTTLPRRVLVVEDEPHIRELVALHLGLEGLAVVEAASGDEALSPGGSRTVRPRRARPDAARKSTAWPCAARFGASASTVTCRS